MRKISLLCLGLLFSTMAFAQIEKGDIQLGGTLNWNSNESGGRESSSFNFTPRAGLFLSNTTSLGLLIGYSSNTQDVFNGGTGGTFEIGTNQFLIGTYARFHKSVIENLYLFLQPSVRIGSGETDTSPTTSADVNTFNVGLTPGLTYFLSPKFALEMSLGGFSYNRTKIDNAGAEQVNDGFGLNLNLSNMAVGMSFYIK